MAKDKITILSERLKEVKEKFDALKKCGIDEEILEIYLQNKTRLSRRKIKDFLKNLEDFYNKLIKTAILNELEK